MAQLFFKYGIMAFEKSIEILKVAHNYSQQNRKVLLLTSSLDDTFGWQNGSDIPFSFNFILISFLAPKNQYKTNLTESRYIPYG